MQDQIGGDHARYGAGRPDQRQIRVGQHVAVQQRREDPAHQIEHDEAPMPHRVLDIVAEHPQEHHVADQVNPPPVQKHV
jgi:hypothetical protein